MTAVLDIGRFDEQVNMFLRIIEFLFSMFNYFVLFL
jgi:hypothetical protein